MSIESECNRLIDYFFQEDIPVYRGKSGYNNTTRYFEKNGATYIVRIYETHNEEAKVKIEHDVLLKLHQLSDLPFQIPKPVVKDGNSLLQLPSNKIGCIYHYIEGENPSFDTQESLFSFGEITGCLVAVLNKIKVQHPFIYRPYYEIEHAHPNCPINKVVEWCSHPPTAYKQYKSELSWIASSLLSFHEIIPKLKRLPHQVIHGDLNASNVLVSPDQNVHAILDFEFTTRDLRVMEIAVCVSDLISKQLNENVYVEQVHHFFSGLSTTMQLSDLEIEALPILIQLRRLDVFLHFLGRFIDGIDDPEVLQQQIVKTASYQHWLNEGGQKLVCLWKNG